jgi:hypothetical protein
MPQVHHINCHSVTLQHTASWQPALQPSSTPHLEAMQAKRRPVLNWSYRWGSILPVVLRRSFIFLFRALEPCTAGAGEGGGHVAGPQSWCACRGDMHVAWWARRHSLLDETGLVPVQLGMATVQSQQGVCRGGRLQACWAIRLSGMGLHV